MKFLGIAWGECRKDLNTKVAVRTSRRWNRVPHQAELQKPGRPRLAHARPENRRRLQSFPFPPALSTTTGYRGARPDGPIHTHAPSRPSGVRRDPYRGTRPLERNTNYRRA